MAMQLAPLNQREGVVKVIQDFCCPVKGMSPLLCPLRQIHQRASLVASNCESSTVTCWEEVALECW